MEINEKKISQSSNDELVNDEMLMGLYVELLGEIRNDRIEIDNLLQNFTDMVFNGGDVSSSSKESVVNLAKIKSDILDKKTKVADLLTSLKIKQKNQLKNSTNGSNPININRRSIIEALQAEKSKNEIAQKEEEQDETLDI
jgi:hypothetical protein